MTDIAILILRVVVGIVMVAHGVGKFKKRKILDKKWLDHYGFPIGTVLFAGVIQLLGGLAVIGGVFTRYAALILALNMLVATYICIWKHHEPFNSVSPGKGWDINLLITGALVVLILLGDGKWSLLGWLL